MEIMTGDKQIHFYGDIAKYVPHEDGSLIVSGIASTEAVDADGEIVTAEAMRKALPSYLQTGTVREMHQPIAAGKPVSAFVDDDGKTHFTAKIIDADTISKIKAGVLKGFSIGGKALKKAGNKITELLLRDISVVDIPNNPESYFTVIKFDKPGDRCTDPQCKNHHEEAVEKCGICKSKEHEYENSMSAEAMQKLDSLSKTVEDLAKTVETLAKSQSDIQKVQSDLGELRKATDAALAAVAEGERNNIISKMQSEGRVAFKEDGTAFKADELQKMELPMLKFAARNAQQLPTVAKTIYTSTGAGPEENPQLIKGTDGKPLTGDAAIEAGFAKAGYTDLNKMIAAQTVKMN